MSDLSAFLAPGAVVAGLTVSSRKALFQQIGQVAEATYGLDARLVLDRLSAREGQATTGYGGGIAMPHARFETLNEVHGVFVQLARPIDYGAVDELPVDLVFTLLSPVQAGGKHLRALAEVSRALRQQSVREQLRGAASSDALYALLAGIDARDAA